MSRAARRGPSGGQRRLDGERAGRGLAVVVGIGVAIAVLGLGAVAANLLFFSRLTVVSPWQTDVTVPGGFLGMSSSEIDQLSFFVAIPGGLLLVALCFIITGRVLRGRVGMRDTVGLEGGTVVSVNTLLSPRAHLAWLAVAVGFWFALVVVPLVLARAGGWPATVAELPRVYVWITLGMYGAAASAIAGVLLVSYLKKQHYLAMDANDDPRLVRQPSGVWRWLTFRWRFDLWLGALGGAMAGASWLAVLSNDMPVLVVLLVGGVALLALGVWMARQYWRAGLPLGIGESFA